MATTTTPATGSALDRWFEITKRGSSLAQEVRGGIVTFITMAYIVVLNPLIIGTVTDGEGKFLGGGDAPNIPLVAATTAILAGVLTIAMGAFGRMPIALAAGLGLNGYVTYTLAKSSTWSEAMGLVVLEGLIILVLVLTGFRTAVFNAVPAGLRYAIGVGIGLFITLIGLVDAGVVRANGVPLLHFGNDNGSLRGWPLLVFCVGVLLTGILVAKRMKGAILIGLLTSTVFAIVLESAFKIGAANTDTNPGTLENPSGWALNVPHVPSSGFAAPKFDLFGQVDLTGALQAAPLAAELAVLTLLLSDFFDTMGTVYAISTEGNLLDENGDVPHLKEVLIVDSVAAAAGGFGGTSSNTSYIESASGVGDGARTGFASLITGALFMVAAFFAPLTEIVPHEAAAPALVIVGFLMMTQVRNIDWDDYSIGIPAFLTMILMPFTYNIAIGIGAGVVSYTAIKLFTGRGKDIKPLLWVVTIAFLVYFLSSPLMTAFGLHAPLVPCGNQWMPFCAA